MSRPRFTDIFIPMAAFAALLLAPAAWGEEKPFERKGPIVITAEKLSAEATKALFEGNVVAKTDDLTMHADKMLVYYAEGNKVKKIEADGNIRLTRGGRVVTSSKALFLADEEKIILTGDPRAVEGENIVTGTKIIYMIKENKSIIENSKVLLRRTE